MAEIYFGKNGTTGVVWSTKMARPRVLCAPDAKIVPPKRGIGMENWRGMLVMPAESEWIIKRHVADAASASLQKADATSVSLRGVKLTGGPLPSFRSNRNADNGNVGTSCQKADRIDEFLPHA